MRTTACGAADALAAAALLLWYSHTTPSTSSMTLHKHAPQAVAGPGRAGRIGGSEYAAGTAIKPCIQPRTDTHTPASRRPSRRMAEAWAAVVLLAASETQMP